MPVSPQGSEPGESSGAATAPASLSEPLTEGRPRPALPARRRLARVLSRACRVGPFLLAAAFLLAACSRGPGEDPKAHAEGPRRGVPVLTATATQRPIPIQVSSIGNVQAYSTVTVTSQVAGQLVAVHFREGQDVKKGQLLFTIDQRPFKATLDQVRANLQKDTAQQKQAEAVLARDRAQLKNAATDERRYAELVAKGYVAREQYDQIRTNAEALQATLRADQAAVENSGAALKADQAAVENARLQLAYTEIRSPMEGRTGTLLVNAGNVVKVNDTSLVTINQVRPVYVTFSVPEQNLSEIKMHQAKGDLVVEAFPPGREDHAARGRLTFINNAVDPSTGTIQLKATFPNTDRALWPGQFVNVLLTVRTESRALVVPSQAIQVGQNGSYVFVVKSDLTVEPRSVVPGATVDGQTVVLKGLSAGETVVTDGQLRLVPGARVEIRKDESQTAETSQP